MASSTLTHFRNYASAGLIAAIGGILSFPILTRNLSVEDYGLLGLVTSTLTVAVAVGKLGIQHSVIRFFAEVLHKRSKWDLRQLYSTIFLSLLTLAITFSVIWASIGFLVLPLYMSSEQIPKLFAIASVIVFIRLFASGVINFLRAQQNSRVVSISLVLHKYTHLSLILLALWFDMLSAASVIFFLAIAEASVFFYVGRALWPKIDFQFTAFSPSLIKTLVTFGLPLMALESLSLIMRLSDRYIIEAFLGVEKLGQYSASYNLASYLDIIIISGMIQALRPMYVDLWESKGHDKTQLFLENSFRLYFLIGLPLILGFSLIAPDLLVLLSGERYAPGTVVIPYIALSFFLEGAVLFLGAGLTIGKNTTVFLKWALISSVLNISLNLLVIPKFGMIGAASMTIVSYLVFMAGVTRESFKVLRFPINLMSMLPIPAVSLLAYGFISEVTMDSVLLTMIVKMLISMLIFASLLLIDRQVREFVLGFVNKNKSRSIQS